MILITGCAGFIGSHLTKSLLTDNWEVCGIDNFDSFYQKSIKRDNLSVFLKNKKFKFFPYDITDEERLKQLFIRFNFTHVVHLAARPGVSPSINNPIKYAEINILGTIKLLNQLKSYKNTFFIFGSSSSVYGGLEKTPFNEAVNLKIPLSPYGISKLIAESYCSFFHKTYGFPVAILRFFTVYGPRVRPDMALFKFIKNIDEGKEINLYGRGLLKRDYTYVDDIVAGIKKVIESDLSYEIINLGNSNPVKIIRIVQLIENILGLNARIKYLNKPANEMTVTYADNTKAGKLLGWHPDVNVEIGIKKTVDWYLNHKLNK